MVVLMGTISIKGAWATLCPVPATQMSASMFQIAGDKKEARATVRNNNFKVWTMYIQSKRYDLNELIIQRTLEANYTQQEAYSMLGCLRCSYRSNFQYPVDFWACEQ